MKLIVRPGLEVALSVAFVMAIYFQTIGHPFSRFDDPFIVDYYGTNSTLSWLDVITPGNSFYYRPLINLSYWIDFQLWGLDPAFMHLENILLHLLNVILVFRIASLIPAASKNKSLPLLCAILFGLHPINSEPVNWIAGRTDVFAGTFVFLAVYFLIRALQEKSSRLSCLAFAAAFVGMLTKETAVMFIPAAFIVIVCWPDLQPGTPRFRRLFSPCFLLPVVISAVLVSTLMLLVNVKRPGYTALSAMFEGGTGILFRSLEAFGFYARKMFLPLPLNAAIVDVSHWYAIVGIAAVCAVVTAFRRPGIPAVFFAISVLFILPALAVAATPIAWTPFGERYLYIPSAFAVMGCLVLFCRLLERRNVEKLFVPIVSAVIVLSSFATFQRGLIWGDNLAMLEDIIANSPNFGVARNEYGILLKMDKRFAEAEKQFCIAAEQKNKKNVDRMIHLNLIGMKIQGTSNEEMKRILTSEVGTKAAGDAELLKIINACNEGILVKTTSRHSKRKLVEDMIETNDFLYQKTHDSFYLYRSGQLALSIEDRKTAAALFKKAYLSAQPDAYYREPARKLAEKLGAE